MCCDICPRFTNCEEESHLNELCCGSCPEYKACAEEEASSGKEDGEFTDEFDGT